MDADVHRLSSSVAPEHLHGNLVLDLSNSNQPATCSLCQRTLSPDHEASGDLETISICGDCKFLFLEDIGSPSQDSRRRRPRRVRRTRYSSSESVETLFSQQFSHMIDLVRQNQSAITGHENQPVDGDTAARVYTNSLTTPSRLRRWRRVLSDTESDGFDNLESLYGETESNVSFGRHRVFHNDSDAISYSAYGGDSDASVDGYSFRDMEAFVQPDDGSNFDSDTDIDPMHAGLDRWNSDDLEEEDDGEWDEDDDEEDTATSAAANTQSLAISNSDNSYGLANWRQHFHPPESNGVNPSRAMEGIDTYARYIFPSLDSELLPYTGNSGDYLDARGFEELLEHLAENDSSRRGAPPAALSFVNSLPLVVVDHEHLKNDSLACAICKELLQLGSQVQQLPCFHLYHPSCIMPWLSSRNTCPLCRYELPTDDKDYEEEKQNIGNRIRVREIQQDDESEEDSSSDVSVMAEVDEAHEYNSRDRTEQRGLLAAAPGASQTEGGRGRWFYLAAPIMGLVGIALMLWLDNPLSEGRRRTGHYGLSQQIHGSITPRGQRENRSRRWWSLF